jgi:AcrR family transcriptional regulator
MVDAGPAPGVRLARMSAPLGGRRAEAARNDVRVLRAAREVLTADPDAPMADIAVRAGVGVGTLYRRYASREALVVQLCLEGVRAIEAEARRALERVGADPWNAFTGYMAGAFDAGAGALGASLMGTFTPTHDLVEASRAAVETAGDLLARAQAAGAVRDDITTEDLSLLFEQVRAVHLGDERRTAEVQRRYLALVMQSLRAPAAGPLPGPPPGWDEIRRRWGAAS